jgi:queuine/archaeosine tRNA-ribosyltransferase
MQRLGTQERNMIIESPTRSDNNIPTQSTAPDSRQERHERAVAQTLRWAQEAATRGAFSDALEWLDVVRVVDGALNPDWQRTQTSWRLLVAQSTRCSGACAT